jgi:hypothetical protein
MDHGLSAFASEDQLGVVLGDRGRDDDLGSRRHVLGVVPEPGIDPRGTEPLHV